MPFCVRCGKKLSENETICSGCSAPAYIRDFGLQQDAAITGQTVDSRHDTFSPASPTVETAHLAPESVTNTDRPSPTSASGDRKGAVIATAIVLILVVLAAAALIPSWLYTSNNAESEKADKYLEQGSDYEDNIDYDKAIKSYNRALEIDPKNVEALYSRGWNYFNKGEYDAAIKDFNEAIRLDPKNADAFFYRAYSFDELGATEQAIQGYKETIKLDPEYAWAYNNLGYIFYKTKRLYDAKAAVASPPPNEMSDQVIQENDLIKKLRSESMTYQQVIRYFSKAIKLNPKNTTAYVNRGNVYLDMRDYHLAIKDYEKAAELDPRDPGIQRNLCIAYTDLVQYDLALSHINNAIKLDPEFSEAFNSRGWIYYLKSDYKSALRDFETSIELDPESAQPYVNAARTYEAIGDKENAAEYRKKFNLISKSDTRR